MKYDLASFELSEATLLCATLRGMGRGASSVEQACQRVARFFCEEFVTTGGRSCFALARTYVTLPVATLPEELARFASGVFPSESLSTDTQCLTLLGTYGDEVQWQSRRMSLGHKTIPLVSEKAIESLPMVARLTSALGLGAGDIVRSDPTFLLEKDRQGFNVFHVEAASGSPYIPAQDFVTKHGVCAVVGFGFVLPPTHVCATILFSRQPITAHTAELFKTVALSLKLALLPLASKSFFEPVDP